MFINKKQLKCLNNLSLEMKRTLIKGCIWSVAVYGPEKLTLRKNEGRIINAFETWCWTKMFKIKWTDRITYDEVFQKTKEERLLVCLLLGISPASDCCMTTFRYTLSIPSS